MIGIPGAGKTFAFHVAATEMIHVIGDDWRSYVRLACPTGSVAYHMAFGARTIHSTFLIEVGKVGESLEGHVDKMASLCKNNPETIFLVIFDEVSMVGAEIFSAVCTRLNEAKIDINTIGFIFFGDPAQCEPIGGMALWTTLINKTKYRSRKRSAKIARVDGPAVFRHIMGMKPLDEIPCMKNREKIDKLREKPTLSEDEINEIKSFDQELGRIVYKGEYLAIYLDQVQRTDGTKKSLEYVDLNTKCRYGKFRGSLKEYREATASKEEFDNDKEFSHATHLTGFHYHDDEHPERITADSSNARCLVDEAERRSKQIMLFKATHVPETKTSSLEQVSAKLFGNMPNYLNLIEGAPVMITCNINPSVGLYNGAKGEFVGLTLRSLQLQVSIRLISKLLTKFK